MLCHGWFLFQHLIGLSFGELKLQQFSLQNPVRNLDIAYTKNALYVHYLHDYIMFPHFAAGVEYDNVIASATFIIPYLGGPQDGT